MVRRRAIAREERRRIRSQRRARRKTRAKEESRLEREDSSHSIKMRRSR